jgi:hypothetical protein
MERHAWMAAHNACGVMCAVFSVWHIVLNRRALWHYLKNVPTRVPTISRETLLAASVITVVLLLAIGHGFHTGG